MSLSYSIFLNVYNLQEFRTQPAADPGFPVKVCRPSVRGPIFVKISTNKQTKKKKTWKSLSSQGVTPPVISSSQSSIRQCLQNSTNPINWASLYQKVPWFAYWLLLICYAVLFVSQMIQTKTVTNGKNDHYHEI